MAALDLATRIRGLRDLPARTALRLANAEPIRRALEATYRDAVTRHVDALPLLSPIDRAIAAGLKRDGYYITSLAALGLPDSDTMLRAARALGDDFADEARARVRAGTDFTIVPPAAITDRPEIFAWGLHDRLLDIAEVHLGLPVAYDGVNIIYTVADGREVATRRWHRDWEDRSVVKVAVYCNDVGEGGGPFQLISRADPERTDASGYHYALEGHAELARRFGDDYAADIINCVGPAGTVVFCDTARYFHRGEPAVSADRVALFFSYFARRPRHPFFCERSGLSRGQVARLARSMAPRQRAAALWRNALPPLLKLIPPAQL